MKALDRKLLRDLSLLKGQAITIALVIACGIAAFVASFGAAGSLVAARDGYYESARFADVFATLSRAPIPLEERIARIPGVAQLETRLVFDVTVDVPGSEGPAVGRMVSIPDWEEPRLNRLHLRRGSWVDPRHRNEVLVSEGFARAHGLEPGDRVAAILNGRRETLRIAGVALSPEYVFPIRGGDPLPDDRSFGVFWIPRSAIEVAFDMEGAFNDVVVKRAPHATDSAIVASLDLLLEPYGGLGAHGRDEQTSNRFLRDEIAQQRGMATTMPVVFLGVAAFLLNVVLSRIVAAQREQIATLKALGYADRRIGLHYLGMVSIVVLTGAAVGIALGAWLGERMTAQYEQFFRFPDLAFRMPAWTPIAATLASFAAAVVGAIAAVRRVVRLAPAAAMRPPAPPGFRHAWLERIGLARGLSPQASMLVRGVAARPVRFTLTALGVACGMATVIIGLFWRDAMDYMLAVQFGLAERGDAIVVFAEPVTTRALRELDRIPGVEDTEGYRVIAVTLRAGTRSYRTAIVGLPHDARLRRLLDRDLKEVAVPADGLLLTRQLGEKLGVAAGDSIDVSVREGRRPRREMRVAALVDDLLGLAAYMDVAAVRRMMGEGDTVNTASLRVDDRQASSVYERLKQVSGVATVSAKSAWYETFERTTATFVLFFTAILTAFAIVIAVGVVYNTARIALQERAWELASLRVLGFTRAEVSGLLLGELTLSLLVALPAGLVLGWWAAVGMAALSQTETFRIPVVITPRTYGHAALVVLLSGIATALLVRRRVDRLDLVAVLKTRE